jgi:predicted dehydrogenase
MMDHVVHLADLFSWILGTEPLEVYALSNRIVHTDAVTVETSGLVTVVYPDGVFATIDCSWNRPYVYPSWGGLAFSVVADRGTIDADLFRQQLVQYGGSRPMSWVGFGTDTNQLMIQEFLDAIAQGRPAVVTGEDGLRATRVALAALASAESGEPVPVDRVVAPTSPLR